MMDKLTSPKQKVFVIKDDKSIVYGSPITAPTRGMFLREIMDKVNEGQAYFAKHPMDFSLFEIGEYDPDLGAMVPYEVKQCLGLVQDLLGAKQ